MMTKLKFAAMPKDYTGWYDEVAVTHSGEVRRDALRT